MIKCQYQEIDGTSHKLKLIFFGAVCVFVMGGCASFDSRPQQMNYTPPPVVWPKPQVNGSIYQQGRSLSLFEDRTARNIGDIITVQLKEQTQASKQANTSVSKANENDVSVSNLLTFGQAGRDLGVTAENDNSFDGSGSADQRNSLTGSITCMVTDVMPNGNLVISGQKAITLNQGEEYLTISGIVRPGDIGDNNTIESTRIANAQISYTGSGDIARSNQMGWLAKFFNSPIWPF